MDVGIDKLRALLAQANEASAVEYKSAWEPSDRGDLLEVTKDIAAMESLVEGGHIIIGADNAGRPSGSFPTHGTDQFDEQRVRSKVVAELSEPLDLHLAMHELDGAHFLIIGVGPYANGHRVMNKEGTYTDASGKSNTVWRKGDTLIRRGTSSVRWNQNEATNLIERLISARKESWMAEAAEIASRTSPAPAPQVIRSGIVPLEGLVDIVLEAIRASDLVTVDLLIRSVSAELRRLLAPASRDESVLVVEIDAQLFRLDVIAILTARYDRWKEFDASLSAYRKAYALNDEDVPAWGPKSFPQAHESFLRHLYAIGAVLTEDSNWRGLTAVARLSPEHSGDGYWPSLIAKAAVLIARLSTPRAQVGLPTSIENGTRSGVIERVKPTTKELFRILGEFPSYAETELLVAFDFYAALVNVDQERKLKSYTNFAFYPSAMSDRAAVAVIQIPEARKAIGQESDSALREALEAIARTAHHESFGQGGWSGFYDQRITDFLTSG